VRLLEDEAGVSIIVDDDGTGVPAEMSNRVLEPFVKLDPSRGHRRGYGLGLNLCQRIVQAHAGDIRIEPREPRGTRVVITLPGPGAFGVMVGFANRSAPGHHFLIP
jgi:signal transduction histidine kinase